MSFLPDKKDFLITNFSDKIIDSSIELPQEPAYREKVNQYLSDSTKPALAKIRNLEELTKDEQEELKKLFMVTYGDEGDFKNLSGGLPLLPYIRKQIGISKEAIDTKLGPILHSSDLNEMQRNILQQILDACMVNGDISFKQLMTLSPFNSINFSIVFDQHISKLKTFVDTLHKPIEWKN